MKASHTLNLLAEEQKKLFEPEISDDERQKRQEMFLELYYRVREKHEAGILAGLSMKTRKRISMGTVLCEPSLFSCWGSCDDFLQPDAAAGRILLQG